MEPSTETRRGQERLATTPVSAPPAPAPASTESIPWKDAFQERTWPGHGRCDQCGGAFANKDGMDAPDDYAPWMLVAPDPVGMPGETLVAGEWCGKDCFKQYVARLQQQGGPARYTP